MKKYDEKDLESRHKKRIKRAGDGLWELVQHLPAIVSGDIAINIFNAYGLSALDVMLLCESHGSTVNIEEFCYALNDQYEEQQNRRQC